MSNLSQSAKDSDLAQIFQEKIKKKVKIKKGEQKVLINFENLKNKGYHGFSKARVTSQGCGIVEFTDPATANFAITQLNEKNQYLGPFSRIIYD